MGKPDDDALIYGLFLGALVLAAGVLGGIVGWVIGRG